MTSNPKGIGRPVPRREDFRLLTGRGTYGDDVNLDGQAHAYFIRSPHAHAEIVSVDRRRAETMPGVRAIFTAEDYAAEGYGGLPHAPNPIDVFDVTIPSLYNKDGSPIYENPILPLAAGRVRHVGECVTMVVAETLAQARNAAETIDIQYNVLPAVSDARDAVKPGAPILWDGAPGNIVIDMERGDAAAVEACFARAAHIVRASLNNPRVAQVPMEPRNSLCRWEPGGRLFMNADTQGVFAYKMALMKVFGLEGEQVHVVNKDVGGGFGMRNFIYPEQVMIAVASKKLEGRPVKWVAERADCLASDLQGRDFYSEAELALDADGRFLALRMSHLYNVGAHTVSFVPLSNNMRLITTCYKFDAAYLSAKAVLTNTVPTGPYRGAGRPEAMHNMERLIDIAAIETGIDRLELRRRNMIRTGELPYETVLGLPLADVDLFRNMDDALDIAGWGGFEARRKEAESRGKLLGIGVANYFETPVGAFRERTDIKIEPAGRVAAFMGTGPTGQGHETVFAQVLSDLLGIDYEQVDIKLGDSDEFVLGGGSHSVRSMRLGGTTMKWAADEIIEKGSRIAAHLLEAGVEDIEYARGEFRIAGTDRSLSLFDAARAAAGGLPEGLPADLDGMGFVDKRLPAYPSGTAVVEVEVDAETGHIRIVRYSQVDDVGQVLNPLLSEGQVHGGIAQGVGQAIMEGPLFDRDTAQVVGGTFMDYAMPRADDFPHIENKFNEIHATSNPLGVKGAGESGTTPAPAALVNAIAHAVAPIGVKYLEMPVTAEKVWRAMEAARGRG